MTFQELANNPQFWIAGVLGVVALIGAYRASQVRGKKVAGFGKGMAMIFLVSVGLLSLWISGVGSLVSPNLASPLTAGLAVSSSVQDVQISSDTGSICPPGSVEDVTVTLLGQDKYTSVATGGTHRYRINGAIAQTVSDAGTLTASGGDVLEVLWMNGSAGSNYFSAVTTHKLDCSKGTQRISQELVQNGTLTIDIFNEEGNLIDTSGENETLSAGDVVTLDGKFKGTFQRGYPYGGVVIVEYNSSDFDDIQISFDGASASKTNLPDFFTVSNTANVAKAYKVPAILSNQKLDVSVMLDVDDSNNPGDTNDPVIRFYPANYFIDEDNGGAFTGPAIEDEDGTQVSPNHITSFTLSVD